MADTRSTIKKLESIFRSRVIVYVTGEREPANILATQIAIDILPRFHSILKTFPKTTKKITLIICTSGGNIDTPWPLVNAIRECCEEFEVVVLNKALSSGTLVTLGADKIYMSKFSQLSPIDPATHYNGTDGKMRKLEIEDTIGYIDFLKNKVGITEQNALAELTKELTKEIEPTRLGSVNRTHALIRNVAKNLLSIHVKSVPKRDQDDLIVHLTEKLYAHGHLINRREAKKIGFETLIKEVTDAQEALLEELSIEIEDVLKQSEPFVPEAELAPGETHKIVCVPRCIIYSDLKKYNFSTYFNLVVVPTNPPQINVSEAKSLWEEVQ